MKRIDHYVILGKKSHSDGWYFIDGYKTLATLRKRFDIMRKSLPVLNHDSIILCSRDYDKNILKIYDEF